MNNFIVLQGLFNVIDNPKQDIIVKIYNEKDELIINFFLAGWEFLKEFLCDDNVLEISFLSLKEVKIKIDTSDDPDVIEPGGYYETHIIINGKNLEDYLIDFVGATETEAGITGLVPAPAAGDQDKYLRGDGTWSTPSGGGGGGSPIKSSIGSASNWDTGTTPTFSVDNNTLIIMQGKNPSLTITPTTVVTDIL